MLASERVYYLKPRHINHHKAMWIHIHLIWGLHCCCNLPAFHDLDKLWTIRMLDQPIGLKMMLINHGLQKMRKSYMIWNNENNVYIYIWIWIEYDNSPYSIHYHTWLTWPVRINDIHHWDLMGAELFWEFFFFFRDFFFFFGLGVVLGLSRLLFGKTQGWKAGSCGF